MEITSSKFIAVILSVLCSCSYPSNDYADDLGDGYIFVSESNSNQFIYNKEDITGKNVIHCTVEAFAFDEGYIIAKQKNNKDCSKIDFSKIPMAYWIIDKKRKTTYGPLDSLSFIIKRKALGISSTLELNK